jgi:mannonate dehydratase
MNRRAFVSSTAAWGWTAARAGTPAAAPDKNPAAATAKAGGAVPSGPARRPPVSFKLGCQSGITDDERLSFFRRHSVTHVCGNLREPDDRAYYTVEELSRLRGTCEKHGVVLDMIAPPFLESTHVDRTRRPSIVLGTSPQRDRDIEALQVLIRNCARAGVPAIKYNLSLLGVMRTNPTVGRGGTRLSTWRLADAAALAARPTSAGRVTADVYWERIDYFLERVIPVAEEFKVRMACHPHDPGAPPGFQGVDLVLGTVEGLKKFVGLRESPYHGLNFCQGTISEMLEDPRRAILDVIRWFGARKKIFNVHFRNIRGRRDDFVETFPDEGDVDIGRGAQGLPRGRLRPHAHARSRAVTPGRPRPQASLRFLLRLHPSAHPGRRPPDLNTIRERRPLPCPR